MKVISLWQPWATLVVTGHKKIETRGWNTKYRGPLLIHAASRKIRAGEFEPELLDYIPKEIMEVYSELPYGAIIGAVNLRATSILCPPYKDEFNLTRGIYFQKWGASFTEKELALGNYSPGRYGWLMSDAIAFDHPIKCKGHQGFWNHELFIFTTENLAGNLHRLGAWSTFALAEEALQHYFPDEFDEFGSCDTARCVELLHELGCGNWEHAILKYHTEVGYSPNNGVFSPLLVNEN